MVNFALKTFRDRTRRAARSKRRKNLRRCLEILDQLTPLNRMFEGFTIPILS